MISLSRNSNFVVLLSVVCLSLVLYKIHNRAPRHESFGDQCAQLGFVPKESREISQAAERTKEDYEPDTQSTSGSVDLAPCGQVCSYDGKLVENSTGFYPRLSREINCQNIMRRMAYRDHVTIDPPPEKPPKELVEEFTISGKSPIANYVYKKSYVAKHKRYFTSEEVNDLLTNIKNGISVNTYMNGTCVQNTIAKYAKKLKDKRGVVVGTITPWLETILLANGASHVTTLEYADIVSTDKRIDAYTPYDFADAYLKDEVRKFDFGASFSSIEHSGLGRYTDPINPYGDLEAMAQVWCMIKPGGFFALGVPRNADQDYINWNANRVYGPIRLQYLTANFKVEEILPCANHNFLILTKTQ